jgi:CheY-like chemotaxis protein
VNDLLDLAKLEAGKTVLRPTECEVEKLFGALRGMLRPLLLNDSVALVFDHPDDLPPLYTDEGKLSQILRNLISNALKFTERGEVRVSAAPPAADGTITFAVSDTGIGIAPGDQSRIFEEFVQVEHPLQRNVKGTGLGLSLSRCLAELLGGTLSVESAPGIGSTFSVVIPTRYHSSPPLSEGAFHWVPDPARLPLLVVEDAADAQCFYEKVLRTSAYQLYPAYTMRDAHAALDEIVPAAIVLDFDLAEQDAWDLLVRLRRSEKTGRTPIVVVSSGADGSKALALGADAYLAKPVDRRQLLDTLAALQPRTMTPLRVLLIDDEEIARYLIRQCLPVPAFDLIEAASGAEGIRRAREEQPDVILLDLVMPDAHGKDILQRLREDEATRDLPVIIVTAHVLSKRERQELLSQADALFSKAEISRETLGGSIGAVAERRARAGR